jgi:hypothetical protein
MNRLVNGMIGTVVVLASGITLVAQEKRPITPADCVTVKYLSSGNNAQPSPIVISPDGKSVAYLVKEPNLEKNTNAIALYVRQIDEASAGIQQPILSAEDIASLQWTKDSRDITFLIKEDGKHVVGELNVATGRYKTLVSLGGDIAEYNSDDRADVIVFAVDDIDNNVAATSKVTDQQIASGYRIDFYSPEKTEWPRRRLFITRHLGNGWSIPKAIMITSPFTHKALDSLQYQGSLFMSLSPDGAKLLIAYFDPAATLPERWSGSPYVKYLQRIGFALGPKMLMLYDIDRNVSTIPLETPFFVSIPLWSPDSRFFTVFAKPPVSSQREKEEALVGPAILQHGSTSDLFAVEADTGKVELVATHAQAPDPWSPPLSWVRQDTIWVGTIDGKILRFSRVKDHWEEGQTVKLPVEGYTVLASDGIHVVGDIQSSIVPPELFVYSIGSQKIDVFAKLDPQFDALALASVKEVTWKTALGKSVAGILFLPPNYKEGERYPLVIETKPYGGDWFACDYGPSHEPSYAPEPIADAGIAYLGFYYPDDHDGKGVEGHYPKGYPGGLAEAAFESDVYDTAVDELVARGLVDRNKVGIIGFSHSGWYTEFALMHGRTNYQAATVVDNVSYDFSEYALSGLVGGNPSQTTSMYGGPPYGKTLKNWLDYSISFNVDKIRSPLLMEEMGYGTLFDKKLSLPYTVSLPFEVFTGLKLLHRPVELYYYPNEQHEPDHPQARLANLQRNLDWYRFWLQGYERPNPEDPDQYKRWEHLRELQDAEDKAAEVPAASPSKPN